MREIASPGQLRVALLRWVIVLVPLVLLLGTASGLLSASPANEAWYAALRKPPATPSGMVIGAVWTLLYMLMGIAAALVAAARGARARGLALALFALQLAINLAWAPIFFVGHDPRLACWWLALLFVAAALATALFFRVRPVAGLLMLPYLAWLVVAGTLAYRIDRLNPDARMLVPAGAGTQIQL